MNKHMLRVKLGMNYMLALYKYKVSTTNQEAGIWLHIMDLLDTEITYT